MKRTFKPNTVAAVMIPLAVALVARALMLWQWSGSPLRYYHGVKGLDMETNLMLGELFYNGKLTFSPHRLIVALTMFFNSGTITPDMVIIIQVLLGIPTGAMIGWIALRLTGKRNWALFSGGIAALYSPLLMHECFLSKDALTVDFAVLSLFMLFWAHKQRFARSSVALTSCCLIFPLFNHLSALPFTIVGIVYLGCGLKWNIRAIATWAIAPALGLLLVASFFHLSRIERFIPFDAPFGYITRVSLGENIENTLNLKDETEAKKERIPRIVLGYLKKGAMLFKPYEVPNNINHYFIKSRLGIFNYLPGPLLLIPIATISILLILCSAEWRRRFILPLLYIIAYSLPLIAFYPLARYRIILCPVFCLLAPYLFYLTKRLYLQRHLIFWFPPFAAVAYGVVLFPGFDDELLRATDFVAFGKAHEFKYGNKKAAEDSYREAVAYTPSHLPGVINLAESLIVNGKSAEALSILSNYCKIYPEHPGLNYYYALSLMGCGRYCDAATIFKLSPLPDNPLMQTLHNFYHGECLRLTGNPAKAMEKYREALKTADQQRKKIITATMNSTAKGLY